jgi:uncharacterized membrane protein
MVETMYLGFSRGGPPVPCSITNGCGDVLTSVYSEVGGIPISWLGFAFYLLAFGVAVFSVFGTAALRLLRWPAAFAFAVSLVLTGIQGLVLDAWCQYCLASALLSTSIAALVWTGPKPGSEYEAGADSFDEPENA